MVWCGMKDDVTHTLVYTTLYRPVARGGSGGSEEPPSWKKGPQFQ